MIYMKLGALVAVGAVTLVIVPNEAVARTGGFGVAGAPRAGVAAVRSAPHAFNSLHRFRHRGRQVGGYFWPDNGVAYGVYAPAAEPMTAPLTGGSNEVRYTTTYDVPWDWVHRFPANVIPSDRPYVPGCDAESVEAGGGKTVNVIRCY
jgi:hypothetical protein